MWADGLGGDKGTGSLVPCPSMPTSPPSRRAPLPLPSVKLMLKAPHVHGYWLWPSWNARRCVCVYEYVFTGVPRVHSALGVAWRGLDVGRLVLCECAYVLRIYVCTPYSLTRSVPGTLPMDRSGRVPTMNLGGIPARMTTPAHSQHLVLPHSRPTLSCFKCIGTGHKAPCGARQEFLIGTSTGLWNPLFAKEGGTIFSLSPCLGNLFVHRVHAHIRMRMYVQKALCTVWLRSMRRRWQCTCRYLSLFSSLEQRHIAGACNEPCSHHGACAQSETAPCLARQASALWDRSGLREVENRRPGLSVSLSLSLSPAQWPQK